MLSNRNLEDLHKTLDVLRMLNTNTDNRYKKEIGLVFDTLLGVFNKLKLEQDYLNKLLSFKSLGFMVDKYINKPYEDLDTLERTMKQLINNIQNLIVMKNFVQSLSNVSNDLKREFFSTCYDPDKYLQTVHTFSKIRSVGYGK